RFRHSSLALSGAELAIAQTSPQSPLEGALGFRANAFVSRADRDEEQMKNRRKVWLLRGPLDRAAAASASARVANGKEERSLLQGRLLSPTTGATLATSG